MGISIKAPSATPRLRVPLPRLVSKVNQPSKLG